MDPKVPKYGRGKFEPHVNYVAYMHEVVSHPNFTDMPNALTNGRVNWQVSTGKGTSLHEFYDARFNWWIFQADKLHLPGSSNSEHRFSIAARIINPTGKRPCRLCGEFRDVGFFYLNAVLAKKLNKKIGVNTFEKWQSVEHFLNDKTLPADFEDFIQELFPERIPFFEKYGFTVLAFENARHVESNLLSPGYMANPPDRLDGFHDYCLYCRGKSDPGRSEANMRSYAHDRRAFEYWAEGDWKMADDLYNLAGSGECKSCSKVVERVSPDHIGPLSCGFKQIATFIPLCTTCNSAKNRRMKSSDVKFLIDYEEQTKESVASWQVRSYWDFVKNNVETDDDAKKISTAMRSIQDLYLRILHDLLEDGNARFLSLLLHPNYAFYDHTFENLDTSTFLYSAVSTKLVKTPLRESLARRSVRIAFEELRKYSSKSITDRKLQRFVQTNYLELTERIKKESKNLPVGTADEQWNKAVEESETIEERERIIGGLITQTQIYSDSDRRFKRCLETEFTNLAKELSEII
jgi:Alw26I/Eco31I/Esp3I family type II restriction endonuclease